ncbi:NAD+ synthase [Spongiibacter sp. KMU-166]|uniref:Glutamine-dependent NAD(+) synthetase n=1 Tax=Spongiibacter thalassae TaxID=2721624 RepID=A0ABX1GKW9_9GAMM|nr:NAD+ synthase [Spongiibacter thalassae]NKI18804.1 NAD+ synthase [Spongiibacter thalassae]
MTSLRIVTAQINPIVGDIEGNTQKIIEAMASATAAHTPQLILFPELVVTGYPPEDLLLRSSLKHRVERALARIAEASAEAYVVVGYPRVAEEGLYNAAGVFFRGRLQCEYYKQCLPNYRVFDEKRYFIEGREPLVFDVFGVPTALSICEDVWEKAPTSAAKAAGAQLLLNMSASPFHAGKQAEREALLAQRAWQGGMPIVYCNLVGGQDELVFDGASMVVSKSGELMARSPAYVEHLGCVTAHWNGKRLVFDEAEITDLRPVLEDVYETLVLGVRDYVEKNGFKGVVLGLSGGIDSGLTLAIAVDALGAERVQAVMMPFRYTSSMSIEDAEAQAELLGVEYQCLSIEPIYESFMATLADEFAGTAVDKTEENLQARCRGVLLMAISNKKGYLVLTTGNKSEVAVGYSTLYGDMAGGFDVLKDVSKCRVFELARFRNTRSPAIPQRVIDRPPSAELAPDQKDEDSLPPYPILDKVLERYIEHDESAETIIEAGYDRDMVYRVLRLVDLSEYKRRQSPIGTRITERGFGRDRRYPITQRWPIGD